MVFDDCSATLLSASCRPASATVDSALVTGGVWCLYASAVLALLSLWIYMAGVVKYMT